MSSAVDVPTSAPWEYIETTAKEQGLDVDALPSDAGITSEEWDRCRAGADITVETARALARTFDINLVDFMVAAGMIDAEEVTPRPDPSLFTDQQVYAEVGRRFQLL